MSESTGTVTLTIDGRSVTVPRGTTIWEAARELDIDIPVLCHSPRMRPVGVCRVCVVDLGERAYAASCVRQAEEGMQVHASSATVEGHRAMLTRLLLSDYPEQSARESSTGDDQMLALGRRYGISELPFPDGTASGAAHQANRPRDDSSRVIAVDHEACILCDRCVRACDEMQHNDVITRTGKGYTARIAFDLNQPMGESTCVSCGECMEVCPTGALTDKAVQGLKIVSAGD